MLDIEQCWRMWAGRVDELDSLVAYNQAAEKCRGESLEPVVQLADRWEPAATYLTDLFEREQISSLLEMAFRERPALALFDGEEHSELVRRFRELDRGLLTLNRLAVALQHARRVPAANTANGQIGVLHHEFEKKRAVSSVTEVDRQSRKCDPGDQTSVHDESTVDRKLYPTWCDRVRFGNLR